MNLKDIFANAINKTILLLAEEAPTMKVGAAYRLAEDLGESERQAAESRTALLVLAIELAEMGESGQLPDDMYRRMAESERLQWALSVALNVHAGWSCGLAPGIKGAIGFNNAADNMAQDMTPLSYCQEVSKYQKGVM